MQTKAFARCVFLEARPCIVKPIAVTRFALLKWRLCLVNLHRIVLGYFYTQDSYGIACLSRDLVDDFLRRLRAMS
jgi:hypothetical protein